MAKVRSVITYSGTIGNVVHVDSQTYGEHTRAPRGTYKEATVNEAFKRSSSKMIIANDYAKCVRDSLLPFRGEQYDKRLWSRLHEHIREKIKTTDTFDFSSLEGFRISQPWHGPVIQMTHQITHEANQVNITAELRQPYFPHLPGVDHYEVNVIMVFICAGDLRYEMAHHTETFKMGDDYQKNSLAMNFKRPDYTDIAMLVVKCQAIKDKGLLNDRNGTGMQVMKVERIENFLSVEPA